MSYAKVVTRRSRQAVAVVVSRVDTHARLGPPLGVDRHPGEESHALERAVSAVPVEEVRVRVVRHEEVRPAVVVVVRGHHAEAVGTRRVGEAVDVGRLGERAVPAVLEEEVGLARQPGGPHHDPGAVPPHERPLRAGELAPARVDVAGDVEVQVPVAVGVDEGATGAPAGGLDARGRGHFAEACRRPCSGRGGWGRTGSRRGRGARRRRSRRRRPRCPSRRCRCRPSARRPRTSSGPGSGRARSCGERAPAPR